MHTGAGLPRLAAVGHPKHLLIDGSNILHAWSELHALLPREREVARAKLVQEMRVLHDVEQLRLTLVFDGRGAELVVEHPGGPASLAVIFTPTGTTADDVIEQLVANAQDRSACCVATDDRGVRLTVEAGGATCISSRELRAWVDRAAQRQDVRLAGRRRDNEILWRKKYD